jgi:hypothetical protein
LKWQGRAGQGRAGQVKLAGKAFIWCGVQQLTLVPAVLCCGVLCYALLLLQAS